MKMELNELSSFLSTQVKTLVIDIGKQYSNQRCSTFVFINPRFTLNWEKIVSVLKTSVNFSIHSQQPEWFSEKVHDLWPIFVEAHSFVAQSKSELDDFQELFRWTSHPEAVEEYFKLFRNCSVSTTEVMLFLTAVIERSLGNLFLLKNCNVPSLLRDLLSTSEMHIILGKVPVLFLQVLMGTPLALNLRNIVWHGFPRPDEIYPHFVSILFIVILSVGEILLEKNLNFSAIPKRPQTKVSCDVFSNTFPSIKEDLHKILNLFYHSSLIPATHHFHWKSALEHYSNGKCGRSILLLLPQFEHMLRCLYCTVNQCKKQMLTAESVTLYTTMNEIMAESLIDSDGKIKDNKLINFLGEPIIEMLQDLFVHQAGPRVRDKISHGECNLDDIPEVLVNHVICTVLVIALKSGVLEENNRIDMNHIVVESENLTEIVSCSYVSKFHPVSLLKETIKQYLSNLNTWTICELSQSRDSVDTKLTNSAEDELSCLITKVNECVFKTEIFSDGEKLCTYLESIKSQTVFRQKSESELITILRQIMENVEQIRQQVAKNVREKCMLFTQHVLRSRQRNTYQRMLYIVPKLKEILFCITCIAVVCLESVNKVCELSTKRFEELIKFCRVVLQFVQNVTSCTKCDKNRWLEIQTLTVKFCHSVLKNVDVLDVNNTITCNAQKYSTESIT